ncbi:MAG TPA: DUF488 family protein, partial [Burkholderiales bacterium]|nr:DUF488 family protein [Burkholderiales bacterium]
RWAEFERRYHRELAAKAELVTVIRDMMREGQVTLLYGASDTQHNNALALRDYLRGGTRP